MQLTSDRDIFSNQIKPAGLHVLFMKSWNLVFPVINHQTESSEDNFREKNAILH